MNAQDHARAFIAQPLKRGHHWSEFSYAYAYTPKEHAMYLGWFDDNAKKAATDKAKEAIAAYRERFGSLPNIILVNDADKDIQLGGITIRVEGYISRNNYWVGYEVGY